ncbi:hypothetical protein [Candidatus Magnetominusculus dajiuhuensis]|uniref:hypothetical protein n=1 Tax=Candidatus Magnetominusculus dajiuhuensis TaxID=3137712 RepID=UPI003B42E74E
MSAASYGKHSSEVLCQRYKEKPYQGQCPDVAKVLIVGQDANYPLMSSKLLKTIMEYHDDGVAFWQNNEEEVHHPFLLQAFADEVKRTPRSGINYHKQFCKLRLDKRYAKYISFVELLDIATYGNTGRAKLKDFTDKVDVPYIARLEDWMIHCGDKLIFVPTMVMSTYLRSVCVKTDGMLEWLIRCDKPVKPDEPVLLYSNKGVVIYKNNHFSGSVKDVHIQCMSKIIKNYLACYINETLR